MKTHFDDITHYEVNQGVTLANGVYIWLRLSSFVHRDVAADYVETLIKDQRVDPLDIRVIKISEEEIDL